MQSLSKLTVEELDLNLRNLKSKEDLVVADLILHLSELDKRKAYRELGYSSLFTYCTEVLKYAGGSAYRRVEAARLFQENHKVYEMLKSGKVNLSSISEVNKIENKEIKIEVLTKTEGKTQEEVRLLVAKELPTVPLKKETIRVRHTSVKEEGSLFSQSPEAPLAQNKVSYNFQLEVNEEFMSLYREIKELIGHVPASEVFMRCMKEYKEKKLSLKRKTEVKVSSETRFIPKATKLNVIKRDEKQCAFIGREGRRCTEKHALQFDHIIPFGKGGNNSENNLRLLCSSHNQLMAERSFGREKIRSYI